MICESYNNLPRSLWIKLPILHLLSAFIMLCVLVQVKMAELNGFKIIHGARDEKKDRDMT